MAEEYDLGFLLMNLEAQINERPIQTFQRIGGDAELVIVTMDGPLPHRIGVTDGQVVIDAVAVPNPVFRFGIALEAFDALMRGKLDVEAAFKAKQVAVEGDVKKFERFAEVFTSSGGSLLTLRSK